jgi:hypothetical protein
VLALGLVSHSGLLFPRIFLKALNGAPASEQMHDEENDCENDQNVNETARHVESEKTQSPADEKDDSYDE